MGKSWLYPSRSGRLEDRQDVARRVLEPGDVGAAAGGDAARDPEMVGHAGILLELDAFVLQILDGLIDVVHRKIENRERRRLVLLLRVDQDPVPDLQPQPLRDLFHLHLEDLGIEALRGGQVVHRETAERRVLVDQFDTLIEFRNASDFSRRSMWYSSCDCSTPS